MAKVLVPFSTGQMVLTPVDWRPVWGPKGEHPVSRHAYPEGEIHVFASGLVQVVMRVVPIIVRIGCRVVGGRFRWCVAAAIRRELAMALRKITRQPGSAPGGGPGASDATQFPALWEHLTATQYPDGSVRETSSIIIVADHQGWRGCLSDKDNGRTMWKTASSVEELLLVLEEGAASDDPTAWRQSAGSKFKGKKRG